MADNAHGSSSAKLGDLINLLKNWEESTGHSPMSLQNEVDQNLVSSAPGEQLKQVRERVQKAIENGMQEVDAWYTMIKEERSQPKSRKSNILALYETATKTLPKSYKHLHLYAQLWLEYIRLASIQSREEARDRLKCMIKQSIGKEYKNYFLVRGKLEQELGNHDKANKLFQEAETKPELTADQKQNENEFQEYLQSLKMTPTTRKDVIAEESSPKQPKLATHNQQTNSKHLEKRNIEQQSQCSKSNRINERREKIQEKQIEQNIDDRHQGKLPFSASNMTGKRKHEKISEKMIAEYELEKAIPSSRPNKQTRLRAIKHLNHATSEHKHEQQSESAAIHSRFINKHESNCRFYLSTENTNSPNFDLQIPTRQKVFPQLKQRPNQSTSEYFLEGHSRGLLSHRQGMIPLMHVFDDSCDEVDNEINIASETSTPDDESASKYEFTEKSSAYKETNVSMGSTGHGYSSLNSALNLTSPITQSTPLSPSPFISSNGSSASSSMSSYKPITNYRKPRQRSGFNIQQPHISSTKYENRFQLYTEPNANVTSINTEKITPLEDHSLIQATTKLTSAKLPQKLLVFKDSSPEEKQELQDFLQQKGAQIATENKQRTGYSNAQSRKQHEHHNSNSFLYSSLLHADNEDDKYKSLTQKLPDRRNQTQSHNLPNTQPKTNAMPAKRTFAAVQRPANIYVNGISYEKLSWIGKGGSGKVSKVLSPDRQIFALKEVDLAGHDDATRDSFLNEKNLLLKLQGQPRIIKLIDAELETETMTLKMIMECGEVDLAQLLQDFKISRSTEVPRYPCIDENHLRLYVQQMLEALTCIHKHNIVHGDLKPANFLSVKGNLKLIDFGIASGIEDGQTSVFRDSQIGTVNYMSPEAIKADEKADPTHRRRRVGPASDVWSLGCITYLMVYGKTPFQHFQLIEKLAKIPDPSYEIKYQPIPNQALLSFMKSCLKREPRERPKAEQLLHHKFLNPTETKQNTRGPLREISNLTECL